MHGWFWLLFVADFIAWGVCGFALEARGQQLWRTHHKVENLPKWSVFLPGYVPYAFSDRHLQVEDAWVTRWALGVRVTTVVLPFLLLTAAFLQSQAQQA